MQKYRLKIYLTSQLLKIIYKNEKCATAHIMSSFKFKADTIFISVWEICFKK